MSVLEVRRRNPEATRSAILEAAETLFVEKGFAATSMSDVATRACVTKSLIHHHFGCKESLWTEVKRQRISHYAQVQKELIGADDASLPDVLRRSIESYFNFLRDNPEYVRLAVWMNLEDPKLSEFTHPELLTLGVEWLTEDQEQGFLRDDVDVHHMVSMFISLCMYWFMARDGALAKLAGKREDADDAYLESMLKVFMEGVLPR